MRRACFSMGSESESLEEGGFIVCMYCSLQENNSFQGSSRDQLLKLRELDNSHD